MANFRLITIVVAAGLGLFIFWQHAFSSLFSTAPYAQPIQFSYHDDGVQNNSAKGEYLLGVGKADITGPVVEINMMGYADMDQVGTGLRQRLYCRAFIVGSTIRPRDRVVYLVLDTQSGDTAIRHGILDGLSKLGEPFTVYTKDNVAVTGTHSHAGPGAWLNYLLPQITSKGFNKASYQAIVDGSLLAIQRAHRNLAPGHISTGSIELEGVNVNRSPYAYDANPEEERAQYTASVDKTMTIVRFDNAADGTPIGMLSWFAVHGTSLYGNNTLISGDNKGVAAYLFERDMALINPNFVAGFSQSNVGDTTPNILGAFCEDTGLPCRYNDSTCDGKIKTCHGRGPFFHLPDQGTKSCFEIGRRQFLGAKSLFHSEASLHRLTGHSIISSFHTYTDLSSYTFRSPYNSTLELRTCSAALGHSFAGGTTDGPGAFDFKQGTTNDSDSPSQHNPLWKVARAFVHEPGSEQIKCQDPKPILLDVGAAKKPYQWTPNIVDMQLLRIGNLIIIVSPGEATTMSGRRWRKALAQAAPSALDIPDPVVVLGGPANSYTHYIATPEEYTVQRYEGASTLYGPHTLDAYINLTLSHLAYLADSDVRARMPKLSHGPSPPINTNRSLSFINPVVMDRAPLFKSFGDALENPSPVRIYGPGDVVTTRFVGANPRNNFRLEGTFVGVERLGGDRRWKVVRTDDDWNLVYRWTRTSTVLGTSEVSVEWEVESDEDGGVEVQDGLYRMRYFGDAKSLLVGVSSFDGIGGEFRVAKKRSNDLGSGRLELARE